MFDPVGEKLRDFFSQYPAGTGKPGEILIHCGQEPGGVYFLSQGHVVEADISVKSGDQLTTHIYHPGTYFPLTWAIADIPNRYLFQSMTPTTFRLAPKKDLITLLEKEPELLFSLSRRLLYGIDGLRQRLGNQVFNSAYGRVVAELLYLGRHFGKQERSSLILDQPFTHQQIADHTGMVRETVSVAMEKLVENQLIHYAGRMIIIPDLERLKAELEK